MIKPKSWYRSQFLPQRTCLSYTCMVMLISGSETSRKKLFNKIYNTYKTAHSPLINHSVTPAGWETLLYRMKVEVQTKKQNKVKTLLAKHTDCVILGAQP